MDTKLVLQIVHWVALLSGAVVSGAAAFTSDVKLAPYALAAISVAQIIHKFADAVDKQDTVEKAVSAAASQIKL